MLKLILLNQSDIALMKTLDRALNPLIKIKKLINSIFNKLILIEALKLTLIRLPMDMQLSINHISKRETQMKKLI